MPISKGWLMAIAYSVVVLILFCVSIYLISTVNPDPVKDGLTANEEPMSEQLGTMSWPEDYEGQQDDDDLIKPIPSREITPLAENNTIKDRRSVRYPDRRNKSKHIILEISDDKGSPRVQILLYPKRPLKQKSRKIRKHADLAEFIVSRKQSLDNIVDESDAESIVKIWPDDTVSFGEEDILIPADVTEYSISEENTTDDLYKEAPTSKQVIDHSLGTPVSGEEHGNGSDIIVSTLTGNESVNFPIESSMVDYTHASIKNNLDSIKTHVVQEHFAEVADTPPPISELSSETNILLTDEPATGKTEIDDIYTNMPTIENPLDNQTLMAIENAVSDSDTKTLITEESLPVDFDSDVSTVTDVSMTDVLISEQTVLDDLANAELTRITESASLNSEVSISIGVQDDATVVPISEQSTELLDIKKPEETVTGVNEPIFAVSKPSESNNYEANILNFQQESPFTEEAVESETVSMTDDNVQESVTGDEVTITSESPSSLSQPEGGNPDEVSEESAAYVNSETQETSAQSNDDGIFKD